MGEIKEDRIRLQNGSQTSSRESLGEHQALQEDHQTMDIHSPPNHSNADNNEAPENTRTEPAKGAELYAFFFSDANYISTATWPGEGSVVDRIEEI